VVSYCEIFLSYAVNPNTQGRNMNRASIIFLALLLPLMLNGSNLPNQQLEGPAINPQEQKPSSALETNKDTGLRKKQQRQEKELIKRLSKPFKKWLTEDAYYIIFPEEQTAFLSLTTDAEREEFIGQFWLRRDPTPDTFTNEYKEEHYRRIAYANRRFFAGVAGWRTDRGHIYVMYGAPDQIKSSEGPFITPYDIDAGLVAALGRNPMQPAPAYPSQKWRYNYIDGVGQNVELEFVDRDGTNAFKLAWDPGEKFGYIPLPGGVFDLITTGVIGTMPREVAIDLRSKRLTQMVNFAEVFRPLERRAEPTEEEVRTRLLFNTVPFQMRADFFRGSRKTTRVAITLSFHKTDLAFKPKGKNYHAEITLQGFVVNLVGRTVDTFEAGANWTVPSGYMNDPDPIVYRKLIELPPGNYKILWTKYV